MAQFVNNATLNHIIKEFGHWIGVRGAPPTMALLLQFVGEDMATLKAVLNQVSSPALFGVQLVEHYVTDRFTTGVGRSRANHLKATLLRAATQASAEVIQEMRDLARQNKDDELKAKWREVLGVAAGQTLPDAGRTETSEGKLRALSAGGMTFVCYTDCEVLEGLKGVFDSQDKHTIVNTGGAGGTPRQIDIDQRPAIYNDRKIDYDDAIEAGYTFCQTHFHHLAATVSGVSKGGSFASLGFDERKTWGKVTGALHRAAMEAQGLHEPTGHRPPPLDPSRPDTPEVAARRAAWQKWDDVGWLKGKNRIVEDIIDQGRKCSDIGLIRLALGAYDRDTETVDLHIAYAGLIMAGGYASYDVVAIQEASNHLHDLIETLKESPDRMRDVLHAVGRMAQDPEVRAWRRKFNWCLGLFGAGILCFLLATFVTTLPEWMKGDELTRYSMSYSVRIGLYLLALGLSSPLALFLLLLHLVWRGGEAVLGVSVRVAKALLHELDIELPSRDELRDYDNHWPLLKVAGYLLVTILLMTALGIGSVGVEKGMRWLPLAITIRICVMILILLASASGWHTIVTKNSSELMRAAAIRKDSITGKYLSALEAKPALAILLGTIPIVLAMSFGLLPRAGTFTEGAIELRAGDLYRNGEFMGERQALLHEMKLVVDPDGLVHSMNGQVPRAEGAWEYRQGSLFGNLLQAFPNTTSTMPLAARKDGNGRWEARLASDPRHTVLVEDLFPCPMDPTEHLARCPTGVNFRIERTTNHIVVLDPELAAENPAAVEGWEIEIPPSGYVRARLLPAEAKNK